ncbi:MAG TPA: PIG-L family deacetylase [Polyangiaceae bacterium]|nr:PIG-L family deacetylase [Polyangiaceae bacterium]
MSPSFDHVYLSPHLDDAVFSCGGTILRQRARGERVLVITVCAGVPAEDALPPPLLADGLRAVGATAADFVRHRRKEDRIAMEMLGVEWEWRDEADAPFRLAAHYGTLAGLLGPVAPDDPLVPRCRELARSIAPGAMLHAPLAVGGHVDHRIVCEAALAARRPISLYEDFPYGAHDPTGVDRRLAELSDLGLVEEAVAVADVLARRIEASLAYASQVASPDDWRDLVLSHAIRIGTGVGVPVERSFRVAPRPGPDGNPPDAQPATGSTP